MSQETTRMLSEHESARDQTSGPIGYEPTSEEEKTIKLVNSLFQKSKNARKAYDEKWLDYYRMFRGKQWKDARPSYRHSEVINLIFRSIQSTIPILTDSMPKPEFVPSEPSDFELARILNDILDSDWTYNNWNYQLTEMLYDSHIYGTGFSCIGYDEHACDGIGGVKFESADPFYQFPDPYAIDVNNKSRYHIEAQPVDIEVLKQRYPDKAQYIKADIIDLSKRDRNMGEEVKYKSPTDNRTIFEGSSAYDLQSRNEALEIVCYLKDTSFSEDEINEDDGLGGVSTKYVQKLNYPNGRRIVLVNGVLCEDKEIDYEDKKFPYARLINYINPRELWGISEIEQLESPQKIFNKLLSFALDVLTLMGNPIWVVDNTSDVDTDNLFNRPGLVVEKNAGSEVRREPGVQLQPYVMQMIGDMKLWFDDISGSNDVSRGVKPEGVSAASAITALQDAANTRIRQKARNIDAFMQNFGQMYLSRVFQYYDTPRVFRITGDDNSIKYFKFHVERTIDPETNEEYKVAKVREFNQGDDRAYYLGEEKQYDVRRRFDVKISTGSNLPFEKNRVESQSYSLYDRGIIDAEEVLKNIRYPNAEAVLQRVAEKQAQAAAMQPPPKQ